MNLRDLKYLATVGELKHFGKAATACNVSQPTLSMQIKKLEEFLGVQLIERSNRQVMLTRVGLDIAARAKDIINRSEQIIQPAKSVKDPLSGELRLAAFPTIAPYLLPLCIPAIKKALPKLKILLIEEKTAQILEKLENGEIDCGILALPLPVQENHLESAKLFDEPFYLAVSRNHHLSKNKTVTFSDLHNVEMLLLDEGHCLREQTLEVCHKIGIGESQNFRATSLETLRQMVASGSAATMIPKLAVRSDRQIAYIPFKKPTPVRTIGLVWRKTSARSKLFHRINELIIGSVNI